MKKLLAILMMFSVYAMGAETASLPLPTTGNVTLTLAEYNRLVELASKSLKQRENAAAALCDKARGHEAARHQ